MEDRQTGTQHQDAPAEPVAQAVDPTRQAQRRALRAAAAAEASYLISVRAR